MLPQWHVIRGKRSVNRIERVFTGRRKAFIPFITAGDPSLDVTEKLVLTLAAAGADLIELGIPFSDPVAEGPVIQAADERSLAAGTNLDSVFNLVERIRGDCQTALALMTYANPVFRYGIDRFAKRCGDCGIDAVIIPDVPFEESEEFRPAFSQNKVHLISMIAPTSAGRIRKIAEKASGFIYCVSSLGVTGVRSQLDDQISDLIVQLKKVRDIPCAVGFGISTPRQVSQMAAIADGVIVGSALVKIIAEYGDQCVEPVRQLADDMIQALDA